MTSPRRQSEAAPPASEPLDAAFDPRVDGLTMIDGDRSLAMALFERQIDCIQRDDREAQLALYDEQVRCEFPFASDRPRVIEGRAAFAAVMHPLWDAARRRGVKVVGCRHECHATDEPGLFLFVFTLQVEADGWRGSLPFLQLMRIRGGLIAEVREYFDPLTRGEVTRS